MKKNASGIDMIDFPDCDGFEDQDEPEMCQNCLGAGFVLTCIDDMCNGLGYCIHGDGEMICPECNGEGEI